MPEADDDAALYAHRLSLFHEDMHAEALVWCRAALGWPAPAEALLPRCTPRPPLRVREAAVQVGWPPGRRGFAFDNEMPGQAMHLDAFEIDAQPVTAGQYQRFVDAGGPVPRRWRRHDGRWQARWFDEWRDLVPEEPVIHVNAHDAQAYAEWAGRRLVRAAEWEHAAATHGSDFAWGHGVWEWTADDFMPHAGFEPGPYADYSAPWFGSHRELRGGSFATHERLHDVRYRNFFEPHRDDVFAGFRTAARAA
jgi:EgtB-related family protein